VKDKNGKLLLEKNEVLRQWEEYCGDIYTNGELHNPTVLEELKNISPSLQEVDDDIFTEEVDLQ